MKIANDFTAQNMLRLTETNRVKRLKEEADTRNKQIEHLLQITKTNTKSILDKLVLRIKDAASRELLFTRGFDPIVELIDLAKIDKFYISPDECAELIYKDVIHVFNTFLQDRGFLIHWSKNDNTKQNSVLFVYWGKDLEYFNRIKVTYA